MKRRLLSLRAEELSVPLREPFVIATARMDAMAASCVRPCSRISFAPPAVS